MLNQASYKLARGDVLGGRAKVVLLSTVLLLGVPAASSGQWPQWRGPGRDGTVSAPARKGQLFALDPSNGEVLWRGAPRSGEHASLVSWGNEVLVFQDDGSLIVGEVSRDRFRPVQKYRLTDPGSWGHPALVDNRIIVKDGSRLAVYRLNER